MCANGNPKTITGIQKILFENYGNQKDLTTNLSFSFHLKKGDKTNLKFFNDIKELNTTLKSNLQTHPMSINDLIDHITITKYLDNIGEPLGSIIRQSNPKSLEAAYQSVCVNQNAETSYRPTRNFDRNKPGNSNHSAHSHTSKTYSKPSSDKPVSGKHPYRKIKT